MPFDDFYCLLHKQDASHWLQLNPGLRPLTVIRRHTFSPQEIQLIYSEIGEP